MELTKPPKGHGASAWVLALFLSMQTGPLWAAETAPADAATAAESGSEAETRINQLLDENKPAEALAVADAGLLQALRDWGERDPRSIELLALKAFSLNELGRAEEALALRRRTIALRAAVLGEDDPNTLTDRGNLIASLISLGRFSEASTQARLLLARQEVVLGVSHGSTLISRGNLAASLSLLGLWQEAIQLQQQTLRQSREVLGRLHADTLTAEANYLTSLISTGQLDEALPLARQSYDNRLAALGAEHSDVARSGAALGQVLTLLGRADEALPVLREAVARVDKALGAQHPLALTLRNQLAQGLLAQGDAAAALQIAEAVGLGFERLGRGGDQHAATAHCIAGQAQARLGQLLPAQASLQAAERAFAALGSHQGRQAASCQLSQAQVQRELGDRAAEIATLRSLIATLERQRQQLRGLPDALKRDWLRRGAQAYRQLIDALLARSAGSDAQEAFGLSEALKARVLVEQIAQGEAAALSELPAEEARALQQLQVELADLNAQLARGSSAEARALAMTRVSELSRDLQQLQDRLATQYQRYAQLVRPQTLSAAEGAKLLKPDQRYLSFVVDSDKRVRAALLAPTGQLQWFELGRMPELDEQVETLRQTWAGERRGTVQHQRLAAQLAARLLGPLAEQLPAQTQLLIAPDGPLWLLPWDALPWRGRPWAQRLQTQQVHSLAVLDRLQQRLAGRSLQAGASLLAMGAPRYPQLAGGELRGRSARGNVPRISPLRGGQGTEESSAAMARLNWPLLPYAEHEMAQVAALFPAAQVHKLAGDAATETRLRALARSGELQRFRYLLFSAHGYFDPNRPEFSSLVLKADGPGTEQDGFVSVPEWLPLRLNSDLVVLSACETARGAVVSGDGLVGLSYALFVAGNANTLATLWPVADRETALFVTRFFARVRRGMPHAQALSETKREFMGHRDARLRQPRHWAGFVLYGA